MSARPSTAKKRRKKQKTVFVKVLGIGEDGKPTCEYFKVTGKKRVAISRREYYESPDADQITARRGVKHASKNGHTEIPGAGHCWPMKCEALAVNPRQVEKINARNKRHGINVEYHPKTGLAIIPDEGEYKKLRRLERVHFNNCYN